MNWTSEDQNKNNPNPLLYLHRLSPSLFFPLLNRRIENITIIWGNFLTFQKSTF